VKVKEIELGVTHEIKIHGDKTWVAARVTASVGDGENPEDVRERVSEYVQGAVMSEVRATVKTVEECYK